MDTASASDPLAISPSELAARLGRPGAPLVLDVRREARFRQSPVMLAGAQRCAPEHIAHLAAQGPAREAVVYCVYGHEVGREAAQALRDAGWNARFLAGGIEGGEPGVDDPQAMAQWRAAALPTLRKQPQLGVEGAAPSRWITRARPKIDRVACPWLVRRFIDPRAEFFYVPAAEVFEQAQRLQATPFDVEGAALSHEWERCSFDAFIAAFGLSAPGLDKLATIVRAADTDRCSLAREAAGLLALSLGLSQLHADDDQAMLEAAMPLYDALYAWCSGDRGETHTWQAHMAPEAAR